MVRRILLVDDDALTRRSLGKLLRSEGYFVQELKDGRTALSLIDNSAFDAVITDFHLGDGIDGFNILIHFNELFPGRCKIVMSGTATDLQTRCASINALYFRKPLTIDALLFNLETLLTKQLATSDVLSVLGLPESRSKWRAEVRQRSKDLQRAVEANRRRYHELRERALALQNEFRDITYNNGFNQQRGCKP